MSVASVAQLLENQSGSSTPTQSFFSLTNNTALSPVNVEFQIITQANNVILPAGLYIVNISFVFQSFNAGGGPAPSIGSVNLQFYSNLNGVIDSLLNPTSTGGNQSLLEVCGSVVFKSDGVAFLGVQAKCLEFSGAATQILVRSPYGGFPPNLTFTKIG
jgi:hypothetical protein